MSMPQYERSAKENARFKKALSNINRIHPRSSTPDPTAHAFCPCIYDAMLIKRRCLILLLT